jgi:Zn-dependent M28 family amino/carboxypeptidase
MNRNLFFFCILIYCSCGNPSDELPLVNGDTILGHLEKLSDDTFLGRMPCSEGEKQTIPYLVGELERMGLKPSNKGSYLQEVPLLTINSDYSKTMEIRTRDKDLVLEKGKDFVIHSERMTDSLRLDNSELVFCGYGIVDEKLGWNDYAGIDMKGKTAVVLVNDPGYGGDNPDFFKGDIMTYFGRWTYKYDEADRQGADGLLIIHETSSAGYPWFVIQSSWQGPQQGLSGIDRSNDCGIKGWLSLQKSKEIFEACGMNITELIRQARQPGFKPIPLNATVSASMRNSYSECISQNVMGHIEGTDYPDEFIIYTAHWDHLGVGISVDGDSIYNGALDNASGTAALLAIAETFAQSKKKPQRSVAFLFVTAEEQGLLGSEYYASHPLFPLDQTVCNLNIDGVNPAGPMKDFTITGFGQSQMDDIAKQEVVAQGRYILEEQEPEKGSFFRSDQFNFAKEGVPVLYGKGGYDHAEKGKEYAKAIKQKYVAENYHSPSDQYNPEDWNVEGMVQDAQIYFNIGSHIANSRHWPNWYPDSEFSRPKKKLND